MGTAAVAVEDVRELVDHRAGDLFAVRGAVEELHAEEVDLDAVLGRGEHDLAVPSIS